MKNMKIWIHIYVPYLTKAGLVHKAHFFNDI